MSLKIRESSERFGIISADIWHCHHGTVVAYARIMFRPARTGPDRLVLCDVETRPGYRHQGHARRMILEIEAVYHATLHVSGSYTSDGHTAFADHLPVLPGGTARINFDPMNFVTDWDRQQPKYPL